MHFLAAGQGRQGGDVHVEDALLVHVVGQGGIQGVDAFHKQYVVALQLHSARGVQDAAPFLEVEFGDDDFAPGEQVVEVLVEQFHVHSAEGFEIVFAVFVLGGLLAGLEVVVEFYHLGGDAEHAALLRDAEGAAGLAAGTGAGHHHDAAFLAAPEYLVCSFCVLAFLPGFAEVDEFDGVSAVDDFVDFLQGVDSDGGAPVFVLLPGCFNFSHLLLIR